MDIPRPAHPEPDRLAAYGLGRLDEAESAAVHEHLEACPDCRSAVEALPDDTFVALLRQSTPPAGDGKDSRFHHGAATLPAPSQDSSPSSATAAYHSSQLSGPAASGIPADLANHPRYRVLELLGAGGMGAVYKAEHRLMERFVALKVISRQLVDRPGMVERFRREVKAAGRLSHPNIAAAHDAEQAGDTHFLVMEFVEGRNLAQVVAERGPLPVADACDCIRQAALGLQYASAKHGMVHRDVKPHNLILTPEGQVKILDFGLAHFVSENAPAAPLTDSGVVMGTPDYVAPEQARDAHAADIRADVYSLGCTLYHLLTGHPPFHEGTYMTKLTAHLERAPKSVSDLRGDIPPELARIIQRMMAKDPAQRYQTPAEVAEVLAPFVPAQAARGQTPARGSPGRTPPRRRFWLGLTVALILALLGLPAYLLGPAVFRISTDEGEVDLIVEVNDPQMEVTLGEKGVTVHDRTADRKYVLRPGRKSLPAGTYEVEVSEEAGGLQFSTPEFTITRGGKVPLKVTLKPVARVTEQKAAEKPEPGKLVEVRRFQGHKDYINCVAFSPDGRRALTAGGGFWADGQFQPGSDFSIRLWDVETGKELRKLDGHTFLVPSVAFAPDGRQAASAGWDKTLRLWDLETGQEVRRFQGHTDGVSCAAFSPDGRRLVSCSIDRTIRLWDVGSGQELKRLDGHTDTVARVAFSPDGRRVISGSGDQFRDGKWLPGTDHALRLWDADTGKELRRFEGHSGWITGLAFAADGRRVLSASLDRTARVWDASTGKELQRLTHPDWVISAAISRDGRRVFTGCQDRVLRLWDVETGKEVQRAEVPGESLGVALSPDDRLALSGGSDRIAHLWRLAGPPAGSQAAAEPAGKAAASTPPAATVAVAAPMPPANLDPAKAALARKAREVFRANCYRCHGQEGAIEGGMNYVLDLGKLVARRKVVPGNPEKSRLFQRVTDAEDPMPPEQEKVRPGKEEIAALRQWIEAGAPDLPSSPEPRTFLAEADVVRLIDADLGKIDPAARPFARYFTITHLANAGLSADELQTYRLGLSKLVNSLSWQPAITVPRAIDPAATVLRIDLRDYRWDARIWKLLLAQYPYGVRLDTSSARAIYAATQCEMPYVRADWFVFAASRPPLYHEVLQLPKTDRDLERLLQIDVPADVLAGRLARAGFNGSGVSRNNRVIERHATTYGAYWRSYDFAGNVGPQNVFAHPLGPGTAENTFQHDGGEVIFNLPNGLQGYMLLNGQGGRIDEGPVAIVSVKNRPDPRVINGVSCMSCHSHGLIEKADQVRAHLGKNAAAFSEADARLVRALYPPEGEFKALIQQDVDRFRKAVEAAGPRVTDTEPVVALAGRFEADLDLATAAAEAGLPVDAFQAGLDRSPLLARSLGALKVPGGTVHRAVFADSFPVMVSVLHLGVPLGVGEVRRFEGHSAPVRGVAFTPDAKRALSASYDRSLRLWDVETGKELRRFDGHAEGVWVTALSPDGRRALSAGRDPAIILWDVSTGEEVRRLTGHTGFVMSLAFAADGRRAFSGSYDGTVRTWDVDTGQELRRVALPLNGRSGVAFSPDGRLALSGSPLFRGPRGAPTAPLDHTLRLWEMETGREVRRLEGHTGFVTHVSFSPDGRRILSGSRDGTIRLWDADTGQEVRRFAGSTGDLLFSAVFSPDGRRMLSGSFQDQTVILWDVESGEEVHRFEGHTSPVLSVAFSPDGALALAGSRDGVVHLWQLPR